MSESAKKQAKFKRFRYFTSPQGIDYRVDGLAIMAMRVRKFCGHEYATIVLEGGLAIETDQDFDRIRGWWEGLLEEQDDELTMAVHNLTNELMQTNARLMMQTNARLGGLKS